MKTARSNRVKLEENLNQLENATGVDAIDFSADIDNLLTKLDNMTDLYDTGKVDGDILRYIPGMSMIIYQGQIDWIETKKTYAASTYTDSQMLEFVIEITANHYINFSTMVLCLPITFRKRTNKANAIDNTAIPVNNFFAHWIKDVTIKRYGDDIAVLPVNTTLDTYKFSESMLKHRRTSYLST